MAETEHSITLASALNPSEGDSSLRAIRTAGTLLVLAALVVFWSGLKGVFVADDGIMASGLSFFRVLWPLDRAVIIAGLEGRPVLTLSFALNQAFLGSGPWQFRIVNIAIHAGAGLLLFGLVRRTLLHCGMRAPKTSTESAVRSAIRDPQLGIALAFAVALLWLVHPLQTASVTYLMQRSESLAGFFLLLTLYAAVRRFEGAGHGWTVLSISACILGMGVKQTMFAAPALVLLYDYTFVSGGVRSALRSHRGLYAGLAFGWIVLGALIVAWQVNDPYAEFGARNPWPYALSQPGVILYYLRLSFWPDPIVMSYAWPYADTFWRIVPPLLAILLLAGLTLWGICRRSWAGFLGAWFFLILAPSSSFAALGQVIQCQRIYLSLAAVSVFAVIGVYALLARISAKAGGGTRLIRIAGTVVLAVATIALGWGTIRRNLVYRTALGFWQDNVAKQPDSRAAQSALGAELLQKNRVAEATACFQKALEVDDSALPFEAHYNLGIITRSNGDMTAALSHFRAAHEVRPADAPTLDQIGTTLVLQGNFSEAIPFFEDALKMQEVLKILPGSAITTANIHCNLGTALFGLKRYNEAASHFREALRINPNQEQAQKGLQAATAAGRTASGRPPDTKH